MPAGSARADTGAMKEVAAEKVAWRRRNVRDHYVGRLAAGAGALRLVGREPGVGVEVALTIPFEEIDDVRVSEGLDETLVGESCVVVEPVHSAPILVREVGTGRLHTTELAARLKGLTRRRMR